jgi:hypothetical protein
VAYTAPDTHSQRRLSDSYTTRHVSHVDPAADPHTMRRLPDSHAARYMAHVDTKAHTHTMRRLPHPNTPTTAYLVAHPTPDSHSLRWLPHTYTSAMQLVHASPNAHGSAKAQHNHRTCCRP